MWHVENISELYILLNSSKSLSEIFSAAVSGSFNATELAAELSLGNFEQ